MSQSVKELTSGDPQGARALTLLSIRSMVMQSHSHLSVNYIYHPCNRQLIIFPLKQHILTKHFFDFTVFDLSGRRKMKNHIFLLTIHVLSKKKGAMGMILKVLASTINDIKTGCLDNSGSSWLTCTKVVKLA